MGATFYSSAALQGPKAYLFKENAGKLRDSTYGAVVLVSILVPICWIIVLLRVYTRTRLIKAFGGEDWAMLAALACYTACAGNIINTAHLVRANLEPLAQGQTPNLGFAVSLNVQAICWYSATMLALKISLGLFFYKIFESKPVYRWIIGTCTVLLTIIGITSVVVTVADRCGLEAFFFVDIKECAGSRSGPVWSGVLEAWGLLNTISDFLYAVLSVIAIANIQLTLRRKASAIALCMLGTLGGVASVVRLGLLLSIIPGYSTFGQTMIEVQRSAIEGGLGIAAASLATLRPLAHELKLWRERKSDAAGSRGEQSIRDRTPSLQLGPPPQIKMKHMSELDMGKVFKAFQSEAESGGLAAVVEVHQVQENDV